MNRRGVLILLAVVVTLAVPTPAQKALDTVVKLVETRYSVRHQGVPGLWFARPFMFGSGVSGLKIAVFEGLRISPDHWSALQQDLTRALTDEWTPFIEARSSTDGDWSMIYARGNGKRLELLIFASDKEDVAVMQMSVSGKARDEWISNPERHAKQKGSLPAK